MYFKRIRGKEIAVHSVNGHITIDTKETNLFIYPISTNSNDCKGFRYYNMDNEEYKELEGLSVEEALVKKGLLS